MDKIKKYLIIPEDKIILEYMKGKVSWGEYMELKKIEMADPVYKGTFDVIADIRDIHTDFTLKIEKEIVNYVEFLHKQKIPLKHLTSIITNTPKQFLHAEFFKLSGSHLPMMTKTVSTYQSAFDYLQLDYAKRKKILDLFEEMKAG